MKSTWVVGLTIVAIVLGLATLIFIPRLPSVKRSAAPRVASRTTIHEEPQGLFAINPGVGMGAQMVVTGDNIWVTYTLVGSEGSDVLVARSHDAGLTFETSEAVTSSFHGRALQPSLMSAPDGGIAVAMILHGTFAQLQEFYPGMEEPFEGTRTGLALQFLDVPDSEGRPALLPLIADQDSAFGSPVPVLFEEAVYVAHILTAAKQFDQLRLWQPETGAQVEIDDDSTHAPKLGFSILAHEGRLHVAYTDGRLRPSNGLYLYHTWTANPADGFQPSTLLDPGDPRFWQSAPELSATSAGKVLIGSTKKAVHYHPASYRDKLTRHGVGGIYQVQAWSREPMAWISRDNGDSFTSLDSFNDQDIEATASGVHVVEHGGQLAMVWMENRPIQEPPDIRWITRNSADAPFSATAIVNEPAQDLGTEELYGTTFLADGTLLVLYRDTIEGQSASHRLMLARSVPLGMEPSD